MPPGRHRGASAIPLLLAAALGSTACEVLPQAVPSPRRGAVQALTFGLEIQSVRGERQPANEGVVPASGAPAASATPAGPTSAAPSAAASPVPAASEAPILPPRASGGGGRRGGGASTPTVPPNFDGRVLDEAGAPVALAEVRTGDGRSGITGGDGVFHIDGPMQAPVTVVAAGYATSTVQGLDAPTDLHVRSVNLLTAPAERVPHGIGGTVAWPLADLQAATAYYLDFGASRYTPGVVSLADGRFGVQVRYRDVGRAGAVFMVNGVDAGGQLLLGVSTPFDPTTDEGPSVTLNRLTDTVSYATTVIPAGLTGFRAQLELTQEGAPPLPLVDSAAETGTFAIPPAAALPGTMRLVLEARDGPGDAFSSYAKVIERSALSATGRLLAVPVVAVDAVARTVSWAAVDPSVEGYVVEVYRDGFAGAVFEAWTTGTSLAISADQWPDAGAGSVIVRAVDADGIGARQVASAPEIWSARQLRLAPWVEKPDYRTSSRSVRL